MIHSRNSTRWMILTVQSQREKKVEAEIRRGLGLQTHVPCTRKFKRSTGKGNRPVMVPILVPIMPGYVFVGSQEQFPLYDLRTTEHVHGWVQFGGIIGTLSDRQIDHVRRMAKEATISTPRSLDVGDQIHVTEGPFRGLDCLLAEIGVDTVSIDVYLFGRPTRVTLPAHAVERV